MNERTNNESTTRINNTSSWRCVPFFLLEVVKKEELDPEHIQVVHKTAHCETVVVSKEGFVPYTTRISNYFFIPRPGDDR